MQFANIEVIWNDTYVEATPESIPVATIDVAWDPGLTDAKGR
jgi:hypothetical protein